MSNQDDHLDPPQSDSRPRPRQLRPAPAQRLHVAPYRTATTPTGAARFGPTSRPAELEASVCGCCGFPISETAHGWLNAGEPGGSTVYMPCPGCAPSVQARRVQARLDRSTVGQTPDYVTDWTWETLQALPGVDMAAVAAAAAFSSKVTDGRAAEKRGLYLYGRLGRGKTSLAVCILQDARSAGLSVGFVDLAHYFWALRRAAGGREDAAVMEAYDRLRSDVDVLVLDDLGVGRPTGFVLEELYGLIEDRAASPIRRLWTIITSNYDLQDLVDTWVQARGITEADRVAIARIKHRIRRYYALLEVAGDDLCPAGSPASDDGEESDEEGEEADDE